MLEVKPNSRQIPSVKKYTANKDYNDLVYAYLQENSYLEDGFRCINRKEVNYVQIGKKLNLARQTVSTKFKRLIDLGLVIEDKDRGVYILSGLDKYDCQLIPYETLRMITSALNQNCVSIYVYLLKRFIGSNEEPYQVTMKELKGFIGLSVKTSSNNYIINDILYILEKLELIWVSREFEDDKTIIIVDQVTNELI